MKNINFDIAEGPDERVEVLDPLDVDWARSRFIRYKEHIHSVLRRVNSIEVTNEKEQYEMIEIVAQGKTLLNDLDSHRKRVIAGPDKFVRAINAYVKGFRDNIENVIKIGKRKLDDYSPMEIVKKYERDKEIKKVRKKVQKKIETAAKNAGIPKKLTPQLPALNIKKTHTPVRALSGTGTIRMVWVAEIVDEKLIPRKYLTVNKIKIDAAVRAGIREIAGVSIKQVPDTNIRRTS